MDFNNRPKPVRRKATKTTPARVFGSKPINRVTASYSPVSPVRIDSPPTSLISVESVSSSTSDETAAIVSSGDGPGAATIDELASLSCPICNESMVTLLQLNRHLDDVHSEVEKVENEQLRSWFKKKVEKAKQLQAVTSVFQSSFGKLDLFEDGSDQSSHSTINVSLSGSSTPRRRPTPVLTDEHVTRKHWQKSSTTSLDRCSDLVCDKILNNRNGSVNCRQCGKLFCSEHTRYQMKLSKNAKHDTSVNGIWCRVCETCYKSRPGYNDHLGIIKDQTNDFKALRQKRIDLKELEVNRLEKRLLKLMESLALESSDDELPLSGLLYYNKMQQRKKIEREVTDWQNDKTVEKCPICKQKFGYLLRKHHCRVCGKVICGDVTTGCSKDVEISILAKKLDHEGLDLIKIAASKKSNVGIRMCRDCKDVLFARKNFETEIQSSSTQSQILRYYDSMARLRKSIEISMPKFQAMLLVINDVNNPPSHNVLTEAAGIRRKLMDSFVQYDNMARKLLACHVDTDVEKRLQKQIFSVSAQFLQDNMLPLKALPKALKHIKAPSVPSSPSRSTTRPNDSPGPSLAESEENSSAISEEEEQNVKQQIIVMQEQQFMVNQMIEDAKGHRRFDEVASLEQNLKDLNMEVDKLEKQVR